MFGKIEVHSWSQCGGLLGSLFNLIFVQHLQKIIMSLQGVPYINRVALNCLLTTELLISLVIHWLVLDCSWRNLLNLF